MNHYELHKYLSNDEAYNWSIAHSDAYNMRLVLRAYGLRSDDKASVDQLYWAIKYTKLQAELAEMQQG